MYNKADVYRLMGLERQHEPSKNRRRKVIYARVSSAHQKANLDRQISTLNSQFPEYEVIQDIGSGLNFKRKGFEHLLVGIHEEGLPTETDYAGLDLTSLNGSLRNTKLNSWFLIQCQSKTLQTDSMNWLKTYLPSQITLWRKTMAFEQARLEQPDKENKKRPRNTKGNQAKRAKTLPHQTSSQQNRAISEELVKRKVVIGTKSVRLHPTPVQKKILKQWMGSYRYLYNQALSYTENHSDEPVSIKTLRRHLINDTTSVLQHPWLKEIPYDIKDEALRDFLQSYNSNRIKAKETKVSFKMKFKTKRSCQDSCTLLAKHWNTHKKQVFMLF